MKRCICLLLTCLLLCSLTACGEEKKRDGESGTTEPTTTVPTESMTAPTATTAAQIIPPATMMPTTAAPAESALPATTLPAATETTVPEKTVLTCTFSIDCSTVLDNVSRLDADKVDIIPAGGRILPPQTVEFTAGESVFDVLQRVCRAQGIHMESAWVPMYNSAYIEGIHNLYEFDCGSGSGWMYCVNGWYPNYGCSRYVLKDGDTVEWRYTCELGDDIGGANSF